MTLNCNNTWNKRATEGHGGNEFTEKDADHVEKQEFLEIHLNLTWKKDKTNIAEEGKVSQAEYPRQIAYILSKRPIQFTRGKW